MVLYLCFRFCIFDKPILEEYFFRLKGFRLVLVMLHVGQDDFPLAVREMHHFFESLVVIGTSSL